MELERREHTFAGEEFDELQDVLFHILHCLLRNFGVWRHSILHDFLY